MKSFKASICPSVCLSTAAGTERAVPNRQAHRRRSYRPADKNSLLGHLNLRDYFPVLHGPRHPDRPLTVCESPAALEEFPVIVSGHRVTGGSCLGRQRQLY